MEIRVAESRIHVKQNPRANSQKSKRTTENSFTADEKYFCFSPSEKLCLPIDSTIITNSRTAGHSKTRSTSQTSQDMRPRTDGSTGGRTDLIRGLDPSLAGKTPGLRANALRPGTQTIRARTRGIRVNSNFACFRVAQSRIHVKQSCGNDSRETRRQHGDTLASSAFISRCRTARRSGRELPPRRPLP